MKRHAKTSSAGSTPGSGTDRNQLRRSLAILTLAVLALVAWTSSASAQFHVFSTSFGAATSTPANPYPLSAPTGVAVDDSGGSSQGDVYVADPAKAWVQKFDSTGHLLLIFGKGVDQTTGGDVCTVASTDTCQPGTPGAGPGAFTTPNFVAVDDSTGASAGDVYVGDTGSSLVQKFDPSGALIASWGSGGQLSGNGTETFSELDGVAVGPSGTLFVLNAAFQMSKFVQDGSFTEHFEPSFGTSPVGIAVDGEGDIYKVRGSGAAAKLDPTGEEINGELDPGPSTGIAVDLSQDDAYIVRSNQVSHYTSSGTHVEDFGIPQLSAGAGAGADSSTHTVYVADTSTGQIDVFPPPPPVPPSIGATSISRLFSNSVELHVGINPNYADTKYHFEYVDQATFLADQGSGDGFQRATVAPEPDATIAAGASEREVSLPLAGLNPATTYHYRVVASNGNGAPVVGTASTFATPASHPFLLPDNRAWEQVSPVHKNGFDVLGMSSRTPVAEDGNSADFASIGSFGDVMGSGLSDDYMAQRSAAGWATHALNPLQDSLNFTTDGTIEFDPRYVGVSPDLSTGVFAAWSPLTHDPDVAEVPNLYLRRDLRQPGSGSFELLTACPFCQEEATPIPPEGGGFEDAFRYPTYSGASSDFQHLLFQSPEKLTSDAPAPAQFPGNRELRSRLYESDHGVVHFVGLIPPASATECGPGGPVCEASYESVAGAGGKNKMAVPHAISTDGSRVFFTVPKDFGFEGKRGPGREEGDLYMRVNGDATVQIDAQETTGMHMFPAASVYRDASPDGSRVFFINGNLANGDYKLYMYDSEHANDEVQKLSVAAGSGAYILGFEGQSTNPIAFDAGAATVQSELNALSTIGGAGGSVSVTGGPGDATGSSPYSVSFGGSLAETDVPEIGSETTGTAIATAPDKLAVAARGGTLGLSFNGQSTGGSGSGDLSEGSSEVTNFATATGAFVPGEAIRGAGIAAGTRIAYLEPGVVGLTQPANATASGVSLTAELPFDAAAATVEGALNALSSVGGAGGSVSVTGGPGDATGSSPYTISFGGSLAGTEATAIGTDASDLQGMAEVVPWLKGGGHLSLLSGGLSTTPGSSAVLATGDQGHYVYFAAEGQLNPSTPNLTGYKAGIYLWHDDGGSPRIDYVGELAHAAGDVSSYLRRDPSDSNLLQAEATPDGRQLVFMSSSGEGLLSAHGGTDYDQTACVFAPTATQGCKELYLYSADSQQLRCLSCSPFGYPPTADAKLRNRSIIGTSAQAESTTYEARSTTDDGRYVFFTTAERLVDADTNGVADAYEYDTRNDSLHLISSGTDPFPSAFLNTNPSGSDVFFVTRAQLVGQDNDGSYDLYDARVNGGLASQNPITPALCAGDSCQGGSTPPPRSASPGSLNVQGAGNPVPKPRKHKKRHHKHHRKAGRRHGGKR